ncbi:MAG: MarR family transcriptional regulator, partial [Planctomycetota bacterium]
MPAARLDDQLCFALYSASNRLTNIYRPILESMGLTYTQFVTLMALWEKDDVSISQLAQTTGLSKPTMTPLLKR